MTRDWITQDELARLFPHGLPIMAVKLLFPEKSEPLNTAEVYAFLVALARLPELRGKNLACWCKPGTPCHSDVLMEIANG